MSQADRDRWDRKYRGGELAGEPASVLLAFASPSANHIPLKGTALDVAGGSGRNAIWLSQRGLDVTLTDISAVALDMAERRADQVGVALRTVVCDFDRQRLPAGPWDVIVNTYFLHRPLFGQYADVLAKDGVLIFAHSTHTNLRRHARPSARFLLDDGELPGLLEGLTIVSYTEGWTEDGRHEARLVARRQG